MSFRLLFLLLSLLLVPLSAPAHAAITALFESPLSGPVAGVQVVRGWAFVPEPGDTIARVELVVDGVPAMTIPCCGERADVATAYPQYSAAVTLHSGWGLTVNWSLLPPGLHTVQVEITTAQRQQWRSEVREVEVVTVGGFEFLDLLSLADATVRLEGDEIVLDNVRVRDHASGQERAVTLRLRWDPNAQTLSLSGAVTTASLTSLRSTLRGVLTPMWRWLARASGAREVQAAAGIVSEWESPSADALVSGVQVMRGWMFAEEVGVPIAAVRVVLDGRIATTLPCCSARGDVAAAFPDNPNALDSGAALVVNYGNLTAGPHALGLEIEAANGAMLAFTRAITVLKIGGFDYLDQFDLSQATVRLEGEEIVLTDVRVREEASGREKVLTLRFRWDTAPQGFVLAANDPPVASDQRVATESNDAVAVTLQARDADDDPLRFAVVDGPAHGQLTGEPPLLRYTPDTEFVGEDSFTFVAQDFTSASNVATVTLTVTDASTPTPTNDPPQVDLDPTNLSGQQPNFTTTFTEDSGLQAIVSPLMTVTDPDSATLASATATLTNVLDTGQEVLAVDPATVTPNTPIVATYDATNGELSLTGSAPLSQYQAALRTLTYTNASQTPDPTDRLIQIVANDGAATSTPVTSTVSIQTVNDQPTFTATNPPAVGENAGPQTLTGWATFNPGAPEETGQTVLAYTVSAVSNPGLFTTLPAVATDGTLTYTPAANTVGTSTFTVTVQDDGGTANGGVDTSAPQTFTITVTAVNKAPTFTKGADQTVLEDVGAQTVNGWATGMDDGDAGVTQTLTFLITNTTNPTLFSAGPAVDAATGALTYTPAPNANGSATITLVVRDDGGTANSGQDTSAPQTFTISVTPVNDAPSFTVGPDQTINENAGAQTVDPWATGISPGPTDEASQTLTFNITGNTNPGLFSAGPAISATGVLTYTPTTNASGTATIMLTLSDTGGTANGGQDTSAAQTFTITVTVVDDPPVAVNDTATVTEDDPATTMDVLANDTDSDGGLKSIASVTQPTNGTVVNNGTDVSYTPNPDYCNTSPGAIPDTFTYTLTPGNSTATVSVTVTCGNDAPVVDLDGTADDPSGDIDFAVPFTEGTPVVIVDAANLTVTDVDSPNLDSATVTITNLLDVGVETLTATPTGSITVNYVAPALTLTGTDTLANYQQVLRTVTYNNTSQNPNTTARTITFVGNDGTIDSALATSTVTIQAINSAPSFTKGADQTVNEDAGAQTVSGWATAISDGDGGGQTLTFNVTGNTDAALFSTGPAISPAGVLTYTPAAGANGTATITITLSDDGSNVAPNVNTSAPQTFIITVNAVNDAPSFTAGPNQTILEDSGAQTVNPWATSISAGPADEASQTLTFNLTGNTDPGLFSAGPTISPTGVLTYTPAANVSGSATITLTLSDNGGTANGGVDTSAAQTFTITVTLVDDPPMAVNDTATVTEDDPATTLTVLANDTDTDAGPKSIAGVSQPANGTVVITNGGADLTYQPNPDYCNTPPGATLDTFTYTLTPGGSSATVSVTVTCVNDAPVVNLDPDNSGTMAPNFAVTFTEGGAAVVLGDSDLSVVDGDSANLATATLTLTNLLNAGQETLSVDTTGTSLTAVYTAPTLTLTGSETLANYQQVLRAVRYSNSSTNPDPTPRSVTFMVNDGSTDSTSVTSTVTINAINSAPSFTKGADQTVNEDAGAQTVTGWATVIEDGDGGGQTLTFNVTGNTNTALFSAQPAISTTGVLTYTPVANANGTAMITLTLSDDGGTANGGVDTSAAQTFTITVNAVNDAPSFTAANPPTVLEDSGAQTVNPWATSISAGPADEASQTVTFNITGNTNAALFSAPPAISPVGVLTYTPTVNASGSAMITLTLSDNGGTANGGVDISTAQSFTITVTNVNDIPVFTKGPDVTVNEDAGAQTVSPWATGIDDGDPGVTQTLTFNVTGNTNPGLFSAGPAVSSTGVLTFTPAANAFGSATITLTLSDNGGTANGGVDTTAPQNFTITVNPVNDPPVVSVAPGPFSAIGNVRIQIPDGASDLLANANDLADGGGTTLTVNAASITSTNGGTVSVNQGTGQFSYEPAPGFTGADTFTYQVCDNGVPGTACSANVTVTVNVSGMIWFVDVNDPVAGGDGRLTNPFNCLVGAGCFDTAATDEAGDALFIAEGNYTCGLSLLNTEVVLGDGSSSDPATILGLTVPPFSDALPPFSGVDPVLSNPGGSCLTLGQNNTIRGLTIGNTSATGSDILGTNFGTLTLSETTLTGTGQALNLATGTLAVSLDGMTSTSGVNNVSLTSVAGTANFGGGALSGATGTAVNVDTGTATISYSGSVTNTGAARLVNIVSKSSGNVTLSGNLSGTGSSTGILVQNNTTSGTIAFTGGSKVLTTGANPAITLDNNDSATLNFSGGGLVITTTSGAGFNAINGATAINVSGAGNTITSTTGTALNVNNSTLGGLGLTFQSISANGGANGIVLNTTGALGGLTVTGTGATDGTGGTIQNITTRGASFINATNITLKNMNFTNAPTIDFPAAPTGLSLGNNTADNAAIHLQGVTTATLDNLNITGSAEQGINGHNVNGFTLSNSTILNAGNGPDEDGLHFYNMVGTSSITDTTITSSGDDNVNIQNNTTPIAPPTSVGNLTITGGSANTGVLGSGYLMGIRGTSNTTVTIDGVTSNNNFSGGIVIDTFDTATSVIEVKNSSSTNNNDGISLSSNNGNTKFDIHDNVSFAGNDFGRINILKAAFSTGGTLQGKIRNNPLVVADGQAADGISVFQAGDGTLTVSITNNDIDYRGTQRAILIQGGQDGSGQLNATVTGNSVDMQLDGTGNAATGIIAQVAVASPSGDNTNMCADIGGAGGLSNTFTHSLGGNMAAGDIRVRQRFVTTVTLPGYGGANNNNAAVVSYLAGRNTLVNTPTATATNEVGVTAGAGGFVSGAPCQQPIFP